MTKLKVIILMIFITGVSVSAQTCGFGCLGLSGTFGGYTFQNYETEGLNNYLINKLGPQTGEFEFSGGKGFRVGGNIVRAKFDNYFFTVKGYYQFLSEQKENKNLSLGDVKESYELKANHWGVGVDFGIPVCDFIDLKIIDGGVTFQQTDYEEKEFNQDDEVSLKKYENDESDIGYYVGSGFIVHLLKDYVSIEGTAFYSFMKISNLIDDDGKKLLEENSADVLNKGGFALVVQLNVGFSL